MTLKGIIREKGRKYLFPAVVGLSLLTGCGKSPEEHPLPISQKVSQEITEDQTNYRNNHLDSLVEDYNIHLTRADSLFNSYIKDWSFSIAEQRNVLKEMGVAEQDVKSIDYFEKQFNQNSPLNLKFSQRHKNLYSLLKENLEGVDWGTPELEKALISRGFYINVEKCDTQNDSGATSVMMLGAFFATAIGLGYGLSLRY